jgi:transposase-like protein
MNILDFYKEYPDELSCKLKFKAIRDKEGVICKKCNSKDHYWKNDKWSYECKQCKYRTSLRSGTVMQSSKLPYQYWFIAMHLLTATKKSFSAKEIQRQLKHKRYEPIWLMMHKIRSVMGLRDDEYQLSKSIEIDEGFFETVNRDLPKDEVNKRGRGSQKQTTVLVMIQSEENTENKNKNRPDKKVGYLKMKVLHNLKSATINQKIEQGVALNTAVVTDNYSSYKKVSSTISHTAHKVDKTNVNKVLPWVHTAISNAKRLLLDVHHRIDDDFLQNYLNEFCYKFNRRYFEDKTMERLIIAGVNHRWNKL